jgi:hypothetical protein
MPRIPHFLNNRLTVGGYVVSLTCRPHFTPQNIFWYSFLLEAESTPGPSAAERIRYRIINKHVTVTGTVYLHAMWYRSG